jgi:hypothetical protein
VHTYKSASDSNNLVKSGIIYESHHSIEYSGTATNGIEILMNPQIANPTQAATTQQYAGSYASSANALAAAIKTRVLS